MRIIQDKTIELPSSKIIFDGEKVIESITKTVPITYFKVFRSALETPPKQGWKIEDLAKMKDRMDLMQKLNSNKSELTIEESEFELLKSNVEENSAVYSTSKQAYDFLNYLNTVEKVNIKTIKK